MTHFWPRGTWIAEWKSRLSYQGASCAQREFCATGWLVRVSICLHVSRNASAVCTVRLRLSARVASCAQSEFCGTGCFEFGIMYRAERVLWLVILFNFINYWQKVAVTVKAWALCSNLRQSKNVRTYFHFYDFFCVHERSLRCRFRYTITDS